MTKLLFLSFFPFVVFGQIKYPNLTLGIEGGINMAKFTMPDNSEYTQFAKNYNRSMGSNFGIIVKANVNSSISFESGALYFNLNSKTNKPELVFEDDFVVINDIINYFDGKVLLMSNVEYESFKVPLRLSVDLLKSKNFKAYLFGGMYKSFILNFKNNYNEVYQFSPQPKDLLMEKQAEISLYQNYSTLYQNISPIDPFDKQGIGFNYGIGLKLNKKIEFLINFDRPEDTLNQGAIYRFNSTSFNFRYFL